MPVEQLRPLLLIGLAVVGFLLWQEWQEDFGPGARREPAPSVRRYSHRAGDLPDADRPRSGTISSGAGAPDVPAAADVPSSLRTGRCRAPPARPPPAWLEVRTDALTVRIDPRGGTIRQVFLPRYPISIDEPDRPFVLMDDRGGFVNVAESGLVGSSAPNHHAVLTPEQNDYELGPGTDRIDVRLHWQDESGVRIAKVFEFARDSYEIGVRYQVRNEGAASWTGQAYGQFRRIPPPGSGGLGTIYTYTGAVLSSPDKPYEKIDFDDMASEDLDREVRDGWIAMIQHYFASAWIPKTPPCRRVTTPKRWKEESISRAWWGLRLRWCRGRPARRASSSTSAQGAGSA